jgi:hypothetical protein
MIAINFITRIRGLDAFNPPFLVIDDNHLKE